MKKNLLFVLTFLLVLFMMPKVNATVNYLEESSCKSMLYEGRLTGIDCNVRFKVTEKASTYNRVTLRITMPSDFLIKSNTVEAGPGWRIVSRNDETHTYTLESDETSFAPGSYQLFKLVSYGSSNSNNCDSSLRVIPETIARKCVKSGEVYYDRDGNVTTELEYEKQCKTHKCEILSDGTRYGKEGTVVTELEYEKQCKSHQCEILSDGTRYGKNGTIVDEDTYNDECVPKKPVCEIKDDKYYDDEGKETSKEEYEKKCKKIKCEYRDHQYYDLNGEVTTKEEYDKQCKKHYCEVIDNTYYDKNGNVVNKTTYEASCKKNICVIVNGKYYDKKGNEVSKGEYENSCVSVPVDNPPTGAETPYIALLGGLVVSGTIFYETKKKKNCFYSIK